MGHRRTNAGCLGLVPSKAHLRAAPLGTRIAPSLRGHSRALGQPRRRLLCMRRIATLSLVLAVGAALSACGTSTSSPTPKVNRDLVLGSKNLVSYGIGWGTAHPRLIFNGGDPSGGARHLEWRDWGAPVAYARGLAVIPRPGGNFYPKLGRIELRAWGLGRCAQRGPRAYTRLLAREAPPGGPLSGWEPWSGWRSICKFSPTLRPLK